MTNDQLREVIKKLAGGTIFSVRFTKKDGTERSMVCRLGVKKHLAGGEMPYDPIEKGLLPVYDLQKKGYRCIPLSRILKDEAGNYEIHIRGQQYVEDQ
jgi:hypothetical protein